MRSDSGEVDPLQVTRIQKPEFQSSLNNISECLIEWVTRQAMITFKTIHLISKMFDFDGHVSFCNRCVPIIPILQKYKRCPVVTKDRIYARCPVSFIFNCWSRCQQKYFVDPVLRSSSFGSFFETVLSDPIIQKKQSISAKGIISGAKSDVISHCKSINQWQGDKGCSWSLIGTGGALRRPMTNGYTKRYEGQIV